MKLKPWVGQHIHRLTFIELLARKSSDGHIVSKWLNGAAHLRLKRGKLEGCERI
jgi:hypothetical protein